MRDFLEHLPTALKTTLDTLSWATALAALVQVLPAIAAVFSITWYAIRIYESETVQKWLKSGGGDEATPD